MINKKLLASLVAAGGFALTMTACDVVTGKETLPDYGHSVSITSQIEKELLASEHTKFLGVHVETVAGGVQLSGTVDTQQQKDHIGKIAQHVANQYQGSEKPHIANNIMVMKKTSTHR